MSTSIATLWRFFARHRITCKKDGARERELFALISKLFRKRWDEAEAKVKETRFSTKLEIAALEKKIAQFLDRIVESDSATVIGAYEREVEELERGKLVMLEKTARCGPSAKGYDESFRTAF